MGVEFWIEEFLERHRARFDPPNWPQFPEELALFVGGFVVAFGDRGVTEAEAESASEALMASPNRPRRRDEHLPRLIEQVKLDRDQRSRSARFPNFDLAAERKRLELWELLDDHERGRYLAEARDANPNLGRWPALIAVVARDLAYQDLSEDLKRTTPRLD